MLRVLRGVYRCTKLYLQTHEQPDAYRRFVRRQIQQQMLDQLLDGAEIIEETDGDTITFTLEMAVFDPDDADLNKVALQRVRELVEKTSLPTDSNTEAFELLELLERRHCL